MEPLLDTFTADSPLVAEVLPSPNHGDRLDVAAPDMLVLHYTGMASTEQAIALHGPLEEFLAQDKDEASTLVEGYRRLEQILSDVETEN